MTCYYSLTFFLSCLYKVSVCVKGCVLMSFIMDAIINDYEVRGVTTGVSKKGNTFKSLRLESMDGRNLDVSCTDSQLFTDVDKLSKGDMISCTVRAVAGKERSYVSLLSVPTVHGNSYKG